jgi:hypothetical protein
MATGHGRLRPAVDIAPATLMVAIGVGNVSSVDVVDRDDGFGFLTLQTFDRQPTVFGRKCPARGRTTPAQSL